MGVEAKRPLTVVISGPSGAGKDETVKGVLNRLGPRAKRVVTYTSRPPRENEVPGVDYVFVSREEFEAMISRNEFEEYVYYGGDVGNNIPGDYKGTTKESMKKVPGGVTILRIDPKRAAYVAKFAADTEDKNTKVFYIGVENLFVLKKRATIRGDYKRPTFNARLREDWVVWKENEQVFREKGTVIINRDGELEKTIDGVIEVIESTK